MPSIWVDLSAYSLSRILGDLFQLRNNVFNNIALDFLGVKVLLEVKIRQFVSGFELSVVLTFLLNCIISQMDQPIGDIF